MYDYSTQKACELTPWSADILKGSAGHVGYLIAQDLFVLKRLRKFVSAIHTSRLVVSRVR